jgi:UDP-glucose 4-epimerase
MKVLVTGGAGFIGSHVVDGLLRAGHEVCIVDSLWERGGGRLERVPEEAAFYKVDIRDRALSDIFAAERPQVVCHLAAQHSVRISTEMPKYDAEVNTLGLINVLQCCTRFRADKIVYSSSAATYGTAKQMPVDEETPQHPESPYGTTKLAGEHYLRFWKAMHGLDYTALRYGNVYGPRQDPTGEAGVIAIFARAFLLEEPVRIEWDGEQQKDYVFVEDVARANLCSLTQGGGEAYCIATGAGTSVNQLYRELAEIVGYEAEVIPAPKRPGDIRVSYFDCSKAKAQLGWEATVPLDRGMRATVQYFRQQLDL